MEKDLSKHLEIDISSIFDTLDEIVLILHKNSGDILYSNKKAQNRLGYKSSELLEMNLFDLYPHKDQKKIKNSFTNSQHTTEVCEYNMQAHSGELISVSSRCTSGKFKEQSVIIYISQDKTEELLRKKAEAELVKERNTLKNIIEFNPYAIEIKDTNGNHVSCNQAFLKMFKSAPPTDNSFFNHKTLIENGTMDKIKEALQGKVQYIDEVFSDPHDMDPHYPSSPVWHKVIIFPIFDTEHKVENLVFIHEDVSQRKNAEQERVKAEEELVKYRKNLEKLVLERTQALTEANERLQILEKAADQSVDGIAITNMERIVQYVNPSWANMHQLTVNECIGAEMTIFHSSNQFELQVLPYLRQMDEKGYFSGQCGHIRKDSTEFITNMTGSLIKDRNGKDSGYIAFARDISNDIAIENALLKERIKFENVVQLNPYAIGIYDQNGYFISGNNALHSLFHGFPSKNYSVFEDKAVKKSGVLDILLQVKEGKVISNLEGNYNPRDANPNFPNINLYLKIVAFPIYDLEYKIDNIVIIYEDLTSKKRAEEELAFKEMELQHSSILSMISSMFIHNTVDVDSNLMNGLRTLGFSLKCNFIGLFEHHEQDLRPLIKLRWSFVDPNAHLNLQNIEKLLAKSYLREYSTRLPEEIFKKVNLSQDSKVVARDLRNEKINSLLFVPIFVGTERFGTLVLNDPDPNRTYSQREVHLSLNIAIIIGLALKNESNIAFMSGLFDALSKLNVGAFIIQDDSQGIARFLYINNCLKEFFDVNEDEPEDLDDFLIHFAIEDKEAIKSMYKARLQGDSVPNQYFIAINMKNQLQKTMVSIITGEINKKKASFGFIFNWDLSKIKWAKDVYCNLNEK